MSASPALPDVPATASRATPRRALSVFDATSIIVGIIIGASIYEVTPQIASNTGSLAALIAVWLLGGFLAAVGALCYAELATTYPEDGGDYVYLKRAFGRRLAFLFAWAELWIIRPGSIGAMAFIFAHYANQLLPLGDARQAFVAYAAGSIILLTGINLLGVKEGKWTQNLLTAAKVVGLLTVFAVAFSGAPPAAEAPPASEPIHDYRLAFILVLFAYGGWSEVAYVAAEVRDAKRNILHSLLWGIGIVTCIYVLANLAFAHALGFVGLQSFATSAADKSQGISTAVAAEVLRIHFGESGSQAISLLICISTLGAINGQIFTGARIYYALGTDSPAFARLGRWNARLGTPVWSLALQAVATLAPVLAFGRNPDGFSRLVAFNAPAYWCFFLLVGIAIFVLADRDVHRARPFRIPCYPWTPLVFCLMSGWMLYASCSYAYEVRSYDGLWIIGILGTGIVVSLAGDKVTGDG